jgi:hypothetical protein
MRRSSKSLTEYIALIAITAPLISIHVVLGSALTFISHAAAYGLQPRQATQMAVTKRAKVHMRDAHHIQRIYFCMLVVRRYMKARMESLIDVIAQEYNTNARNMNCNELVVRVGDHD